MATIKYSRQRECIKSYLASTRSHPTADIVYAHVKEEFPKISLGTVYRNLNLLAELGDIIKITTPDGADRFDGFTEPHYHILCTKCGHISDLAIELQFQDEITKQANQSYQGQVHSHTAMFYGTCDHCLSENFN